MAFPSLRGDSTAVGRLDGETAQDSGHCDVQTRRARLSSPAWPQTCPWDSRLLQLISAKVERGRGNSGLRSGDSEPSIIHIA